MKIHWFSSVELLFKGSDDFVVKSLLGLMLKILVITHYKMTHQTPYF